MKQSVKYLFMDGLFRLYEPFIIRLEKLRATRMWRDGVRQCEKMAKELNGPRVYLFYDAHYKVWSPMTYESNKQYKPALKILRMMGKMHGAEKVQNVGDMKRFSFYYTPSRWGAIGCKEDNRVRTDKLKMWISYYMNSLSEAMQKCRDYRLGYESRRSGD